MLDAEFHLAFAYDPMTGVVSRNGKPTGSVLPNGYVYLSLRKTRWLAHRVIWLLMTGMWPKHEIDHRNCKKSDNRWRNLRLATRVQNARNQQVRRDSKSGFRGVSWHTRVGKWRAVIQDSNGKQLHLGYFTDPCAASREYHRAGRRIFGEFFNA